MDKFKLSFQCVKEPKPFTGLNGFERGLTYQGRKYNGMYEISVNWGSGEQTKLIEGKLFSEFFQEVVEKDKLRNQDQRDLTLSV